jgi:hypothetical protein
MQKKARSGSPGQGSFAAYLLARGVNRRERCKHTLNASAGDCGSYYPSWPFASSHCGLQALRLWLSAAAYSAVPQLAGEGERGGLYAWHLPVRSIAAQSAAPNPSQEKLTFYYS